MRSNHNKSRAQLADLDQMRHFLASAEGQLLLSFLQDLKEEHLLRLISADSYTSPQLAEQHRGIIRCLDKFLFPQDLINQLTEHLKTICQTT